MRLTFSELDLLVTCQNDATRAAYEDQICQSHTTAVLNSYAYHNPKKMPKLKALLPEKSRILHNEEEEHEAMREEGARVGMRVP